MRREDILLRDAARRGEPRACLDIAARFFGGTGGFARNFKLGLAYIQQLLEQRSAPAIALVGDTVPLEVLMTQRVKSTLALAAQTGSPAAMLKFGVWQMLDSEQREEGTEWVRRSKTATADWELCDLDDPVGLAQFLKGHVPCDMLDGCEVLLTGARDLLADKDMEGACRCLRTLMALKPAIPIDGRAAELVCLVVQAAAATGTVFDLPVELVEASLAARSDHGDAEAQYGLGCALGGMSYGCLDSLQLAARKNLRRAAALLLRAADAGKSQAWLNLFEIASDVRSVAGNQEASRFFLEKAASLGVVQAQRKLGALLLKEATSLEKAELGVHWLSSAAECGDMPAYDLLKTLVLPLPSLPTSIESSIVDKVRAVDAELAARLTLARAFHLTRREALNFNARRDVRAWGLLIPGTSRGNPKGRLAPAIHAQMKAELHRAASFFGEGSSLATSFVPQKARMQKQVFDALSISESMFFAEEIGRSWSHYGFGRHWAARAAPLLQELLG